MYTLYRQLTYSWLVLNTVSGTAKSPISQRPPMHTPTASSSAAASAAAAAAAGGGGSICLYIVHMLSILNRGNVY